MSDGFVQTASNNLGGGGGSAVAVTLNGVVAGNTLVAFGWDGSTTSVANLLSVVSSGGGTFLAKANASEASNNVTGQVYVMTGAAAGTHTVTLTVTSPQGCHLNVVEVTGTGASYSDAKAATQAVPGVGELISSGVVTVTGAATLIAMSADTQDVGATQEPHAGATFTSRDHGNNGRIGSWTLETKAVAADAAGTFSAGTGAESSPHVTLAIAILNAGGGGGGGSAIAPIVYRRKGFARAAAARQIAVRRAPVGFKPTASGIYIPDRKVA